VTEKMKEGIFIPVIPVLFPYYGSPDLTISFLIPRWWWFWNSSSRVNVSFPFKKYH